MATGQDLLDLMQVLDNELLLQTGEPDVARGLIALNAAQDMFEASVALMPTMFGSDAGTVSITAGSETSPYPTGLLRLDKIWMLDPTTLRPLYPLEVVDMVGGQAWRRRWPASLISTQTSGRVSGYWENGTDIYWSPFPSQSDTVRVYGFSSAADITAGGTFAYPDLTMLPICAFATKLMKAGVGDDSVDLNEAMAFFMPIVKQLSHYNRDRAAEFIYRGVHLT